MDISTPIRGNFMQNYWIIHKPKEYYPQGLFRDSAPFFENSNVYLVIV